jgi:hypothetical protein
MLAITRDSSKLLMLSATPTDLEPPPDQTSPIDPDWSTSKTTAHGASLLIGFAYAPDVAVVEGARDAVVGDVVGVAGGVVAGLEALVVSIGCDWSTSTKSRGVFFPAKRSMKFHLRMLLSTGILNPTMPFLKLSILIIGNDHSLMIQCPLQYVMVCWSTSRGALDFVFCTQFIKSVFVNLT